MLESPGRVRVSTRRALVSPRRRCAASSAGRHASICRGPPSSCRPELRARARAVVVARRVARRGAARLSLRPGERLELETSRAGELRLVHLHAENARLSGLVRVLWHGCRAADPGTLDGDFRLEAGAGGPLRVALNGRARALALASWAATGGEGCAAAELGAPTDAAAEAERAAGPAAGRCAPILRVTAGGVEARGSLSVQGGLAEPSVELEVEVAPARLREAARHRGARPARRRPRLGGAGGAGTGPLARPRGARRRAAARLHAARAAAALDRAAARAPSSTARDSRGRRDDDPSSRPSRRTS